MNNSEITLREVEESDLPVFFLHQADPEAAAMASFRSRDDESFMAHWRKILDDGSVLKRTILCGGEVAGNIVSFMMEGRREVGYWVGKEYWGRGIATRALGLFLEIETTRPIYAGAAKSNPASIKVLEKCGFRHMEEGSDGFWIMIIE